MALRWILYDLINNFFLFVLNLFLLWILVPYLHPPTDNYLVASPSHTNHDWRITQTNKLLLYHAIWPHELKIKGTKYVSLADYCAMGSSEVSMKESATVELLKVGCAGWWFVRVLGKCSFFVTTFFYRYLLAPCLIYWLFRRQTLRRKMFSRFKLQSFVNKIENLVLNCFASRTAGLIYRWKFVVLSWVEHCPENIFSYHFESFFRTSTKFIRFSIQAWWARESTWISFMFTRSMNFLQILIAFSLFLNYFPRAPNRTTTNRRWHGGMGALRIFVGDRSW